MPIGTNPLAWLLAGALLTGIATTAAAQQAPPRAPAAPAAPPRPAPTQPNTQAPGPAEQTPQRTTATYGDWVVRCEIQPGPPPQKACDMEQLAQMQGQPQPISRVAIPLPAKGETAKLIIQLPVNVSLSTAVKLMADSKDAGIAAPFRRCVPAGCFTEIELRDDVQKKFRSVTEPGKMQYRDSAEHDVTIPLSFKGFGQAFDALVKQ
jgi:invasion protein IalB